MEGAVWPEGFTRVDVASMALSGGQEVDMTNAELMTAIQRRGLYQWYIPRVIETAGFR